MSIEAEHAFLSETLFAKRRRVDRLDLPCNLVAHLLPADVDFEPLNGLESGQGPALVLQSNIKTRH